jgi:hypothetical protein
MKRAAPIWSTLSGLLLEKESGSERRLGVGLDFVIMSGPIGTYTP